jgi:hypothetical protein
MPQRVVMAMRSARCFSTTATHASNVGSYAINGSGLTASANYAIANQQAAENATALTITQRPLTLTYTANAASSVYGNTIGNLTGTTSSSGLVNNDLLSGSASFTTSAGATSNVGSYAVNGAGLTASSNYALTNQQAAGNAAALTITPRPLTITYTASATTRRYGDAIGTLSGAATSAGLVNNDSLGGSASFSTTATNASNVGSYAINGSGLTASANYAIANQQAAGNATALTITQRPLTITANAASRLFGEPNPPFAFTVGGSGLVNNDRLTGALATLATSTSVASFYPILIGTLAATPNYSITYVGAQLEVKSTGQTFNDFLPVPGSTSELALANDEDSSSCSPSDISQGIRNGETASLGSCRAK